MAKQEQLTPIQHLRAELGRAHKWFAQAIPATMAKHLTPERITKIVLTAVSRSPILLQCTTGSIIKAVTELVSLGLEPGGPLGHGYLVPYRNKNLDGAWEAQPIVGYRGFIVLARRSGEIESVEAYGVYTRDEFMVCLGTESSVVHRPFLNGERGDLRSVYSIAKFRDGGRHVEFMSLPEVEAIRQRSRASDNGPWVTDYDEMAKKTVVRRAAKYWPLSSEMATAIELDDRAEGYVVDATFADSDEGSANTNERTTNGKEQASTEAAGSRTRQVLEHVKRNGAAKESSD